MDHVKGPGRKRLAREIGVGGMVVLDFVVSLRERLHYGETLSGQVSGYIYIYIYICICVWLNVFMWQRMMYMTQAFCVRWAKLV